MSSASSLSPELQALARSMARALRQPTEVPADADLGDPLRQPPALKPSAPALLAQSHAAPQARRDAQALYRRCLAAYRQRVQPAGDVDDAGLAAAYFVLANLDVLHDLRPGRSELAQVERQMRHGLGASWRGAPLADRQSGFEQLAVLGTLMTESGFEARRQSAAAPAASAAALAHVQQAARAYLVQFGLSPQRLRLSDTGLVLEAAAA